LIGGCVNVAYKKVMPHEEPQCLSDLMKEPLHNRTSDKNAALKGIDRLRTDPPGNIDASADQLT